MAFAHDKALRTGRLEGSAVTALDLMVKPNAPRFLREGDTVEVPVKLLNRTDKPLSGCARLSFDVAATKRPMDADEEAGHLLGPEMMEHVRQESDFALRERVRQQVARLEVDDVGVAPLHRELAAVLDRAGKVDDCGAQGRMAAADRRAEKAVPSPEIEKPPRSGDDGHEPRQ